MPTNVPLRIGFLLFEGFSNMVLASAIEPLRAACDLSGQELVAWQLLTVDGEPVRSSSALVLQPRGALSGASELDILFVVVGYGAREHCSGQVLSALKLAAQRVPILGGLDTGAWLLAAAGLLDGRRATIHWQELDAFEETFLSVSMSTDRLVFEGERITAGGATTVLELMLRLIRDFGGDALAFDVANMFVYDVERVLREGRGALSPSLLVRAPQLIRAIEEMRRTADDPVGLEEIAAAAACSQRTLDRLFQRELGLPPGRYYQMIRLKLARTLAEETALSVAEIASRTGFSSVATLSRAFSQHFGLSVRSLRKGRLNRPITGYYDAARR